MNIGKVLKELREEFHISQEKLANDLCIDRSTVAKYETNDRMPDADMLCKLADYFKVSVDYLLGREKDLLYG